MLKLINCYHIIYTKTYIKVLSYISYFFAENIKMS